MPILSIQRRMREVGRIRIGEQVPNANGKGTHPVKLNTFRLTAQDERVIAQAAHAYGGTYRKWEGAPTGEQWEVVTETASIDVIVPPVSYAFTQHMECWSGGGCVRRCDGQTELISDSPCMCDPDEPECKPHSRLSLILAALEGFGVWRLDSSGWNAAQELSGTIDVLEMLQGRGQMVPARLLLVQRQSRKPGEAVRKFAVPSLDLTLRVAELVTGEHSALDSGRPSLTPVVADDTPPPSIAAQVEAAKTPPARAARSNAAAALPPSGRMRSTSPGDGAIGDDAPVAEATASTAVAPKTTSPGTFTPANNAKRATVAQLNKIRLLLKVTDEDAAAKCGDVLGREVGDLFDLSEAEAEAAYEKLAS